MKSINYRSNSSLGLVVLIIVQLSMMWALFSGTPPHPPAEIPISGMGPFLGAAIAVAAAALLRGIESGVAGKVMTIVAVIMALLSYGPQKYMDPVFSQVWPVIVVAQIAVVAIVISLIQSWREGA